MRFDSGPEVFVRVNRIYVLTKYVLNENDCMLLQLDSFYQTNVEKGTSSTTDFFQPR